MKTTKEYKDVKNRILAGGAEKYHKANKAKAKMFARDRIAALVDKDSFIEEGLFANCLEESLPADGVVCGFAKVETRAVAIIANDSTVKAGSWGWRTVEKMIRLVEQAAKLKVPIFYLIDSAGARITDQLEMFPGRRGAGKLFNLQCRLSGVVPQICLLFGPSAAGGAYIPAFCDVLIMVKGNASMYLGSPRMAEMVIGEKVSLEEMGGAEMHCSTSGVGDVLVDSEEDAISCAKKYIHYMPQYSGQRTLAVEAIKSENELDIDSVLPANENRSYDMMKIIIGLIDKDSFFAMKDNFAKELITGFARIDGKVIGIVANQPKFKGGVLFVDTADKAARFVNLCNSYDVPLLFLSDVPGFMIGTQVERAGIIRHGAKFVYAISNATVPKICVVIRKAYGAGLYAMCGPAFDPDCTIALPSAKIAVMGSDPAVNAVYFNKIKELPEAERKAFVDEKKAEYEKDIDIARLAAELVVDTIVSGDELRNELSKRFEFYQTKELKYFERREGLRPV